jgi:hypothetical protein
VPRQGIGTIGQQGTEGLTVVKVAVVLDGEGETIFGDVAREVEGQGAGVANLKILVAGERG